MVRDYTKWDDLPISLPHFAESAVRAYKFAMTPPMGPVVLVADGDLQEAPIAKDATFHIPKLTLAAPPQGDSGSVAEAARLLVAAENPVIIAGQRGAHARRHEAPDRTRRNAASASHRPGRKLPHAASAQRIRRRRRADSKCGCDPGPGSRDLWGTLNSFRDQLYRTSRPITKKVRR